VLFRSSPSERDDILVQRPPLALRTLLVLTTQPFRLGFAPTSSLGALLTLLTARNWHIRQAERRNHLLWRSGQTMRFSRWPIVILPADRGMMTRSQFELFVIVEIARAVSRVHSASGIEAELAQLLQSAARSTLHDPGPRAIDAAYLDAEAALLGFQRP